MLLALLDKEQRQELIQYVLAQRQDSDSGIALHSIPTRIPPISPNARLTEVRAENLYFCLEDRIGYVSETGIMLTVKESDIFALLIMNPRRLLTCDMIIDLVWHENFDYCSHRAINNHVSNLRHKFKITPETPDCTLRPGLF